jgi:hypothetical protein
MSRYESSHYAMAFRSNQCSPVFAVFMGVRPYFGTCQAFDLNWGVALGVIGLGMCVLGIRTSEGSCSCEVLVRRSNFTHHKYSYTVWLVGGTFDGCNTICKLKLLFLHQLDQHNTTLT